MKNSLLNLVGFLLSNLLRFESTMTEAGKVTSFAEYIDRAKDDQNEIYYIVGASREVIENGPYLEMLKCVQ